MTQWLTHFPHQKFFALHRLRSLRIEIDFHHALAFTFSCYARDLTCTCFHRSNSTHTARAVFCIVTFQYASVARQITQHQVNASRVCFLHASTSHNAMCDGLVRWRIIYRAFPIRRSCVQFP